MTPRHEPLVDARPGEALERELHRDRRGCRPRAAGRSIMPGRLGQSRSDGGVIRSSNCRTVGATALDAGQIPETAPAGEPQIRLHDLAGRHDHGGQQQARVTT
jgi:hypothetical protein